MSRPQERGWARSHGSASFSLETYSREAFGRPAMGVQARTHDAKINRDTPSASRVWELVVTGYRRIDSRLRAWEQRHP